MMIRSLIFAAFTLSMLCSSKLHADQHQIDSLQNVVRTYKTEDTNLVLSYHKLAYVQMVMDFNTDAIDNYEKAIALAKKINFRSELKSLYVNLGGTYWHIGDLPTALNTYFDLLKISEEMKDTSMIASAYHGIGLIYQTQKNKTSALKYLKMALPYYKKMNFKIGMAKVYNNLGVLYDDMKNYDEALENHKASLEIKKQLGDSVSIATSLNNIGLLYQDKKEFLTAKRYFIQSFRAIGNNYDAETRSAASINLGNLYKHLGKHDSAHYFLNQGLKYSLESRYAEDIANSYSSLTSLDSLEGNFKSAFQNYRLYNMYHDSMINNENIQKTVEAQMLYDFGKISAAKKAEQDKKDAVAAIQAKEQRVILWLVVAVLGVVLVLALFILRSYRQKQKANIELEAKNTLIEKQKQEVEYQKELVVEKQKEIIDSINYAKRIQRAHLPTDKYVSKSLERLKK